MVAEDPMPPMPFGSNDSETTGTPSLGEDLIRKAVRGKLFGDAEAARIGRHVVIERLGAGGMGVVFAAYDPQLDRKIAVKLVSTGDGDAHGEAGRRLLREAKAMARITHPNVIAVYDVGTHQGHVYIAMEFVDGMDLSKWMHTDTGPRPWREVLRVFQAAGRGLVAAHEAGLVHRDFKPANVLLSHRGDVRVLDFGLVRSEIDAPTTSDLPDTESSEALSATITNTGSIMGTPAYMAPEQFAGASTDARTDQFAYCVSLYQALYGVRPFPGSTPHELARAVTEGGIDEAPRGSAVPLWVRKIVLRGLQNWPDNRYPDMATLLRALRSDPSRRRRAIALSVVGLAVVGGGIHFAVQWADAVPRQCRRAADQVNASWSDDRRVAVRQALEGSQLPYAQRTADAVEVAFDSYAAQWSAMAKDSCEATHLRAEQSAELLDLRTACLQDRLQRFDALAQVLVEADAKTVSRAARAAASLAPLDACANAERLRARTPPPDDPEVATAVEAIRETIVRVEALRKAGRYAEARPLAEQALAEAEKVPYEPVLAEARYWAGDLVAKTGDFEAGAALQEQAFWLASALGDDEIVLQSSSDLTYLVGAELLRLPEAITWSRHALAAAERSGAPSRRAGFATANLGSAHLHASKYPEAVAHFEEAVRLIDADPDAGKVARAGAAENLALAFVNAGDPERAEPLLLSAIAMYEDELGPDHPFLFSVLNSLGQVYAKRGDYASALASFERATALIEATDPAHIEIGVGLGNQGYVLNKMGHVVDAVQRHEASVAAFERSVGPDHPRVAHALRNLADLLEPAQARPHVERALAIDEAVLAPDHEALARSRWAVARALSRLDIEPERARRLAEQALPVLEKTGVDELAAQARELLAKPE
jgi:tetratricopeptide (TPR) repeat protein